MSLGFLPLLPPPFLLVELELGVTEFGCSQSGPEFGEQESGGKFLGTSKPVSRVWDLLVFLTTPSNLHFSLDLAVVTAHCSFM